MCTRPVDVEKIGNRSFPEGAHGRGVAAIVTALGRRTRVVNLEKRSAII